MDPVLTEVVDLIGVITINRPEARNAINRAVASAISAAIDDFDSRPDVAVCIITGAGGTFSAGMDLKALGRGESAVLPERGFAGIVHSPPAKPLIAAVEGWAVGGGFEIALSADLIVAASTAQFGLPEVKRGLVANAGGLFRLPKTIPYLIAMRHALTGEPISAARAEQLGLVCEVTEPGNALAGARRLAAAMAQNGPLAVRATKQILTAAASWSDSELFEESRRISRPVFASADAREGARAFIEKRPPVWQGV